MNLKKTMLLCFLSLATLCGMAQRKLPQELKDTTSFIPNTTEGWAMYANYIRPVSADSAVFEIILKVPTGAASNRKQLIGRISKKAAVPQKTTQTLFRLLPYNHWLIEIDPNGRCYVEHVSGELPSESPFVVPLKARYGLR